MSQAVWENVLDLAREVQCTNAQAAAFCPFPDDLRRQEVTPHYSPAADLLQAEAHLPTSHHADLRDAFLKAAPLAHWGDTYKDAPVSADFLARFGYYALIGPNAPFASAKMRAFLVYMPPHLDYLWHHHPAEELYLTIAGQARFMAHGQVDSVLTEGDTSTHTRNQPHATQTQDQAFMAYVIWRNEFETPPVLTPKEML